MGDPCRYRTTTPIQPAPEDPPESLLACLSGGLLAKPPHLGFSLSPPLLSHPNLLTARHVGTVHELMPSDGLPHILGTLEIDFSVYLDV